MSHKAGIDIWADMSAEAVAEKAEQIRLRLPEANDRELYLRLLERFVAALEHAGIAPPADEETLMQQLDLVLVRRPQLLRDAYRRMPHHVVADIDVALPAELACDQRLAPARRALFGMFPAGMNADEKAVATLLDCSDQVHWWHRNPVRTGVGLYRWDDGDGFYPDFIVSLRQRPTPGGIALVEIKGDQLRGKPSEVDKAAAAHRDYGAVFMVGRRRGERDFQHLRPLQGRLETDGGFSVDRLRHT